MLRELEDVERAARERRLRADAEAEALVAAAAARAQTIAAAVPERIAEAIAARRTELLAAADEEVVALEVEIADLDVPAGAEASDAFELAVATITCAVLGLPEEAHGSPRLPRTMRPTEDAEVA